MVNRFNTFQPYMISPQGLFKAPLDIMSNTLDVLQERSDKNKQLLSDIPTLFSQPAIEKDKPLLRSIEQSYMAKIDDIVKGVGTDYSQIGNKLFELTTDLKRDLRPTGKLGAIANNYGLYSKHREDMLKLLKEGKITPQNFEKAMLYSMNNYKGILEPDPLTGEYNNYNPLYAPSLDATKLMEDALVKLKPDSEKTTRFDKAGPASYMKTTTLNEGITAQKALQSMTADLMASEDFKSMLSFRARVDGDNGEAFLKETQAALMQRAQAAANMKTAIDRDLVKNFDAEYALDAERNAIDRIKAQAALEANDIQRQSLKRLQIPTSISAFQALPAWDANKEQDLFKIKDKDAVWEQHLYGGPYGGISKATKLKDATYLSPDENDPRTAAVKAADNKMFDRIQGYFENGKTPNIVNGNAQAYFEAKQRGDKEGMRKAVYDAKNILLNESTHKAIFAGDANEAYSKARSGVEMGQLSVFTNKTEAEDAFRLAKHGRAFKVVNDKITEESTKLPTDISTDDISTGNASIALLSNAGKTGLIVKKGDDTYFIEGMFGGPNRETVKSADEKALLLNSPSVRGTRMEVNGRKEEVLFREDKATVVRRYNTNSNVLEIPTHEGSYYVKPGSPFSVLITDDGKELPIGPNFSYSNPYYERAIQQQFPGEKRKTKGMQNGQFKSAYR